MKQENQRKWKASSSSPQKYLAKLAIAEKFFSKEWNSDHNDAMTRGRWEWAPWECAWKHYRVLQVCGRNDGHLPPSSFTLRISTDSWRQGKKKRGGTIQSGMKTFKPQTYETWDYLNTQSRHGFMDRRVLRLHLDLAVFQNLLPPAWRIKRPQQWLTSITEA